MWTGGFRVEGGLSTLRWCVTSPAAAGLAFAGCGLLVPPPPAAQMAWKGCPVCRPAVAQRRCATEGPTPADAGLRPGSCKPDRYAGQAPALHSLDRTIQYLCHPLRERLAPSSEGVSFVVDVCVLAEGGGAGLLVRPPSVIPHTDRR